MMAEEDTTSNCWDGISLMKCFDMLKFMCQGRIDGTRSSFAARWSDGDGMVYLVAFSMSRGHNLITQDTCRHDVQKKEW